MYLHVLTQIVPKDEKVTHRVKPHATRDLRPSTRVEPLLRTRRGVTLGSAQGVTLCKKKAELRGAMGSKGRFLEYVWSI